MARRGAYRSTPARRAALRKAQLASARKRRGRRIKQVAGVIGAVAGTAAVYGLQSHANRLASNPVGTIAQYKSDVATVRGWMSRGRKVDPNVPGPIRRVAVSPISSRSAYSGGHVTIKRGSYHGRRIRSR